jgi:hypothetical protein
VEADDIERRLDVASRGSDETMDEMLQVVCPRLKEIARESRVLFFDDGPWHESGVAQLRRTAVREEAGWPCV